MLTRRSMFLLGASPIAMAVPTVAFASSTLVARFDRDKDGTVDLAEAKRAAAEVFDKLDVDHEGTLDIKELRGRLSRRELASGDPDHDRTLTKDEYLAVVEQRFKRADKDRDGTISSWEFHTPAGRALTRLLQ